MCCDEASLTDDQRQLTDQAKQFSYADLKGEPFTLHDGVYTYQCDLPIPCYTYAIEPAAFGDLNGDSIEDMALLMESWKGGSALDYFLAALVSTNTTERRSIPVAYLGDRVQIHQIGIDDGVIILDMTVHGPRDGDCCPSQKATWQFQVIQGVLQEVP